MNSCRVGDLAWSLALGGVIGLLLVPATRGAFLALTGAHPYAMGFAKFALLATMGDLLSIRLACGRWARPRGMLVKAAVWGLLGMSIVVMFVVFASGVAGAAEAGLLPAGQGAPGRLLRAFLASAAMNLTFAPAFMAAHRLSDTYIDMRAAGATPTLDQLLEAIDWRGFFRRVVLITIPAFWIPAHTITFLLPSDFRVVVAALLSVALGVILSSTRRRGVRQAQAGPVRGSGR
jgi:hypothetical protein